MGGEATAYKEYLTEPITCAFIPDYLSEQIMKLTKKWLVEFGIFGIWTVTVMTYLNFKVWINLIVIWLLLIKPDNLLNRWW